MASATNEMQSNNAGRLTLEKVDPGLFERYEVMMKCAPDDKEELLEDKAIFVKSLMSAEVRVLVLLWIY